VHHLHEPTLRTARLCVCSLQPQGGSPDLASSGGSTLNIAAVLK
jgi:hypothetical protein